MDKKRSKIKWLKNIYDIHHALSSMDVNRLKWIWETKMFRYKPLQM